MDGNLTELQIASLKAEIDERLKEVNRQMSHYQPDSELSRFNRAPANTPFKVSPEFARVMRFTLDLCRRSHGALDPTLAPVINLWGFGETTSQRAVPSDAALAEALKKTGWKHLSVTGNDELIKDIPDLTINLGAVAKGFGVDEMVRVLQAHGLTNVYASIAGEVRVLGHNARRIAWRIGISAPIEHWNESDPMVAATSLSNQALSTSGDYQKFFYDEQGRRLCHIFDSTNRMARAEQHWRRVGNRPRQHDGGRPWNHPVCARPGRRDGLHRNMAQCGRLVHRARAGWEIQANRQSRFCLACWLSRSLNGICCLTRPIWRVFPFRRDTIGAIHFRLTRIWICL